MKPYIEVLPDQVIIETDAITVTVHVKAPPSIPPKGEVKPYPTGEMLDQAIDDHLAGDKPKRKRNLNPRVCVVCGLNYNPTGSTQRACSPACKAEMKRKRRLSEMGDSELDKTLAEIEERRKRTYQVS